jgi:hypothetical protein
MGTLPLSTLVYRNGFLSFRFVFASEARGAVASARESRHTVAPSDIPVSGVGLVFRTSHDHAVAEIGLTALVRRKLRRSVDLHEMVRSLDEVFLLLLLKFIIRSSVHRRDTFSR